MLKQFFRALYNLYSWEMPQNLVMSYRDHDSSPWKFAKWFLNTKTYKPTNKVYWEYDKPVILMLIVAMTSIIGAGIWFLYWWAWHGTEGLWAFGLALLVGYPLMIAFAILFASILKKLLWALFHPKKTGYLFLVNMLEKQVVRLRKKHDFKVVAVSGSVGKTSTKMAVAQLVGQSLRVLHQEGNYNDRLTVPLIFFGQKNPSMFNLFAWFKMLGENTAAIHQPFPYDVVVIELGTDAPGQMEKFAYIKPDIAVVTAISPEHMSSFKTLDAVAAEELKVFGYSARVLVNGDDIPGKYLGGLEFEEYSLITNVAHNYFAKPTGKGLDGQRLHIEFPNGKLDANVRYVGKQGAKFAVAAAAVADMLGVPHKQISIGLERLEAFAGRMQILEGINKSLIIDDTYNASPLATKAALDVLMSHKSPQRIAILGSMNEMGEASEELHREVGAYINPKKIDLVVTIGADAESWIADEAKRSGVETHSFKSPYQAGRFVAQQIKEGAAVLAKGSQNRIYAEEAIKDLLAHPADSARLVRQSKSWLRKKQHQLS